MKITLYFDCVSPYTYLAWETLLRYRKLWNLELELKPMFLGGVMKSVGNKPPAMLPPRALFQANDLERNSSLFGVDILQTPSNFFTEVAKKIVSIQRILVERQQSGEISHEKMIQLVSACLRAIHSDTKYRNESNELDLSEEVLLRILMEEGGLTASQAKTCLENIKTEGVKELLNANTQEAIDVGAYGSPTMVIHQDKDSSWMTFGSDRFEQIAHVCGLPYYGVNPKLIAQQGRPGNLQASL